MTSVLSLKEEVQFVKQIMKPENLFEFFVFNSVFFVLAFGAGKLIDRSMNWIYTSIMDKFQMEPNRLNLTLEIITQISATVIAVEIIRIFLESALKAYSRDKKIFPMGVSNFIFAFIVFYGQDNLKKNLTMLDKMFF